MVSSLFWLYPAFGTFPDTTDFHTVATAHETTGFSPNILMLGRETSTPLDLVYDMPIVSSVWLKRSTIPSDFGWYGVVLVLVVPSIWHINVGPRDINSFRSCLWHAPWDKTCSCKYVDVGTTGKNRRGTCFGQIPVYFNRICITFRFAPKSLFNFSF
jgi:hypothetical protein